MINIYLDDVRSPPDDGREWTLARTAWQCIALLGSNPGNVGTLSLDHDLGELTGISDCGSGYDVAKWLEGCWYAGKPQYIPKHTLCHSANPVGRQRIHQAIWHFEISY